MSKPLAQSVMTSTTRQITKPFTAETLSIYADRLVRHGLLSISLDDPSHPCMELEDSLLLDAERPIRASADYCRRSAAWAMVRVWFVAKMSDLVRERISYYKFPPNVTKSVLDGISIAGFDHVLERAPGESGVRASPGSNVLFPRQCKTS